MKWLFLFALEAAGQAVTCNHTTLAEAADAYIAAQTTGQLAPLLAVTAANWTYQENNQAVSIATSRSASGIIVAKALKIDHRRTNFDLTACATYTELVSATDPANPYVIGTQIHHATDLSEPQKVVLVDSIVTTTGAWLFDAKKTLQHVLQENWTVILPERARDTRVVLQAAADAYLDMWSNATASEAVPWGTPCTRLEGSAYTGHDRPDDSCKAGIPSNHKQAPNTRRRYVIDESMGSVSVFCVWEHMMNASDSHELRLERGKLRYVHTMTSCGSKACKL
ncbi:hypothetical protein SPBR_06140 [Sporothrix brasiliensis 5110]|uniref:DUF8021 domain-containing protein n=1 Tax=Sporothrix brasiliensis 5110 TaxID=1398154 RepID=A0A0C2IZH9_9PEZI|nr:uncharacterized protein SPBR_06140 [Sporothrix brasiliensis 5110]KIH94521.1 hypothetical protein SPBR_06140 [Sporothrix brasiliensis 5110]